MADRESRISNLAATLKSSGLAKSDSQARMMAEEMIGVEDHVQKSYEEEHAKAHEFLQTSKNLRDVPKSAPKPVEQVSTQRPLVQKIGSEQSFQRSDVQNVQRPAERREEVNLNFRSNSSNQNSGHSTGNSMLEAIKAQVQSQNITALDVEAERQFDARMSNPAPEAKPVEVTPVFTKTQVSQEPPVQEQETVEQVSLDKEKLMNLMEEDGPVEEHTKEIKTKPQNVKPKEEYAENSIDLSSVFSFNKK